MLATPVLLDRDQRRKQNRLSRLSRPSRPVVLCCLVETRRIPAHITNLYPETLQIKDLRAIDRNSMLTFWTFTTAAGRCMDGAASFDLRRVRVLRHRLSRRQKSSTVRPAAANRWSISPQTCTFRGRRWVTAHAMAVGRALSRYAIQFNWNALLFVPLVGSVAGTLFALRDMAAGPARGVAPADGGDPAQRLGRMTEPSALG